MKQPDINQIVAQWFTSLPVLVVWAVGFVMAVRRWRQHPQVAKLTLISCLLSLLAIVLIPVVMTLAVKINPLIAPYVLSLVWSGVAALSIGLLLKATFLARDL